MALQRVGVARIAETIPVSPNSTIDLAWLAAQFPDLTNLSPIGQGGQKIVLSAEHNTDGPVVLKLIHPGQDIERTNRELIAITQVNSPRVPRVLERGQLTTTMGDCVWFRERRVPGESVRIRLRSGPFAANDVILLGLHVLETLVDAEAVNIVHRDVKPDNIMRDPSGAYWLLDFGLATQLKAGTIARLPDMSRQSR
jgi:serine/threonine protein kinase